MLRSADQRTNVGANLRDCALDDVLVLCREAADLPEMIRLLLERAAYLEDLYPGSGSRGRRSSLRPATWRSLACGRTVG